MSAFTTLSLLSASAHARPRQSFPIVPVKSGRNRSRQKLSNAGEGAEGVFEALLASVLDLTKGSDRGYTA